MRLLWIATKAPLPAVDGGRLVAWTTITALAGQGAQIDLVAPVPHRGGPPAPVDELAAVCRPHLVTVRPRSQALALLQAMFMRLPVSIVRHRHEPVRRHVRRLLESQRYDAVHVEQVQALAQAEPALRRGLPVVLRAQNVESDLWRWDRRRGALQRLAGPWMAWEARRLAACEARAVRRVTATVALSERDATRLAELAGAGASTLAIPPPFPPSLPAGSRQLAGDPPLVLMGSAGWLPNRDANRWFLSTVWADVRAEVPGVALHLFTTPTEKPPAVPVAVTLQPSPADSRDAFPPGAILIVPLRIGSGVRMKILEAWARGVCVVATPEAVAGLAAKDGEELLVARDARSFAVAIRRLADDAKLRDRLIAGGRRMLAARHDPTAIARRLMEVYGTAARSS